MLGYVNGGCWHRLGAQLCEQGVSMSIGGSDIRIKLFGARLCEPGSSRCPGPWLCEMRLLASSEALVMRNEVAGIIWWLCYTNEAVGIVWGLD